ncbi:MAG: DUF2953 domain-containing protein [Lachnospiraceae bacterium]|jgi:hypothetical protein|nr:DUF2953 domain-containing protein [Lachnospiraceae bacterium]
MILVVLKVIGIILLVILALIIFILSLVLFVPIRYRFSGEYFEKPDAEAVVKYAPVALNAKVQYRQDKLEYTVRLFGGVIMTNTGAKLSWLGRKLGLATSDEEAYDDTSFDDLPATVTNTESVNTYTQTDEKSDTNQSADIKTDSYDTAEQIKQEKKKSIFEIIKETFNAFIEKIKEIKDKLAKLNKKKEDLLRVYHSKRFEVAKKDVIKYIKQLLKAIKPKHLEGRIHFGMDDPALTGEILGGASLFLPLYDEFLDINPDFEKQCFDGILKGDGKIRLCSIVKIGLKVLFNKNLIKVTKKVQTIIEA